MEKKVARRRKHSNGGVSDDFCPKRLRKTVWVNDDNLSPKKDDDDSDDSEWLPGCDEVNIPLKALSIKTRSKKKQELPINIKLTAAEEIYLESLSPESRKNAILSMNRIVSLTNQEGQIPTRFKILGLPVSDHMKSIVLKKISIIEDMGNDSSESFKIRAWVDAFFKIPFGKNIPLPVGIFDGDDKCSEFMNDARQRMNKSIYGMTPAKIQIMQIIAQWIVNPSSAGNVIALQGPPGIGKTSFAKNAIADVMQRPFEFFSLGGASDISNFVGHAYTYEGSTWGRIADSLMNCRSMNPVLYFDELDKISKTPHGEEIISMLIHMTDRSQNTQFHDRYFSGIDFDLSKCLFVFSLNDIDAVHPILRDRMTVIQCTGYNETDKKAILKDYVLPQVLKNLHFSEQDLLFGDDSLKYLISEFSKDEKGVRTLIRTTETLLARINMLRIAKDPSMREYKFYTDLAFPMTITESVAKKLLTDLNQKEPETWRSLYS